MVAKRKDEKRCTGCHLLNHGWWKCRKEVVVATAFINRKGQDGSKPSFKRRTSTLAVPQPCLQPLHQQKTKFAFSKSGPRPDAWCPPSLPRTLGTSEFSIHCPLAPTALQRLSFFLFSLRIRLQSTPPPDAIHLPPSLIPAPNHLPFLFLSLRIRPQSASPRCHSSSSSPFFLNTPFIFLLTHFPSPHNPSPLPNTTSVVLRTHPAPYLPILPYSPLYTWR